MRFASVGALCTTLHYVVLFALVQGAYVDPVPATVLGYSISTLISYTLNRALTFSSARSHAHALPRFVGVAMVGLGLNALCMWVLASRLDFHYFVAQLFATVLVLCWNYLLNRFWTFGEG
jgi:putative flippase GtrA